MNSQPQLLQIIVFDIKALPFVYIAFRGGVRMYLYSSDVGWCCFCNYIVGVHVERTPFFSIAAVGGFTLCPLV